MTINSYHFAYLGSRELTENIVKGSSSNKVGGNSS